MTDSVLKGFDVTSLMAAAGVLPVGQQKAKYCADVVAQIGSNPIYELQTVAGVVKYRTTVSGSLPSTAAGIALPTQFVEPPTINLADGLTDAVEVIRNATNTSIEIRTPVKISGGTGYLTADKALDGSYTVRTSARYLLAPGTLDVGGGSSGSTGPTADIIVADITTNNAATPTGLTGTQAVSGFVVMGRGFSGEATPSWWSGGNTAGYKADTTWTGQEGWWVINKTSTTKADNNGRIEVWGAHILLQLESTKEWRRLFYGSALGADLYPTTISGAPYGPAPWRQGTKGRQFKLTSSYSYTNIHGYMSRVDVGSYLGDIRNVCTAVWMQLVLDDVNGTDDLDQINYLGSCGCDAYPDMGTRVADFGSTDYNPAMGGSRYKFITRSPQLFIFDPLSNASSVDSSPIMSAANRTITEANMRLYPPPITA